MLHCIDCGEWWCLQRQSAHSGSDCKFQLTLQERRFSSQLRSVVSDMSRLEWSQRILWLPFSGSLYSSFLPLFSSHRGPLCLVPLTSEMGRDGASQASTQSVTLGATFPAPRPGLVLRTRLPGKQGPDPPPAAFPPSFGSPPQSVCVFTFPKPQVVVCCVWQSCSFSSAGERCSSWAKATRLKLECVSHSSPDF